MKRHSRILLQALAFLALVAGAVWFFTKTYDLGLPFLSDDGRRGARDVGRLAVSLLAAGIVSLAFLVFRRSQRELPVFFRAHVFVPVLFVLWVVGGSLLPFSCKQLTQTLPGFLLGANDWGVGNIYAYTKLADWLALLAGCAACARLATPAASVAGGVLKRLRLCMPHLLSAAFLHVAAGAPPPDALGTDLARLFAWLVFGFAAVAALQSLAESAHRRWPLVLAWLVAIGWLFVSVARYHP